MQFQLVSIPANWVLGLAQSLGNRNASFTPARGISTAKPCGGSSDHETGRAAIHMVSAWVTENKLSLGQVDQNAKCS